MMKTIAIVFALAIMSFLCVDATCGVYEFTTSYNGVKALESNINPSAQYPESFTTTVPSCIDSTYGTCSTTLTFNITVEQPEVTIIMSINGVYIQNYAYNGYIGTGGTVSNTNYLSPTTRILGEMGGWRSAYSGALYNTYGKNDSARANNNPAFDSGQNPTQIYNLVLNGTAWNCSVNATNTVVISAIYDSNSLPVQQPYNTFTSPNSRGICGITSYTVVNPPVCASIKGDPQFTGLRGQSYQIHGIDGAIYNLISDSDMQLNSRFVYLNGPRPCPTMPSTGKKSVACWAHRGSYLANLALITDGGSRLLIESGSAATGYSSVTLDGVALKAGSTHAILMKGGKQGSVSFNNSWEISIEVGDFVMEIENSDEFVNIRSYSVLSWSNLSAHGLLGQTWRSKRYSGKVKEIEGDVDDYVVYSGDMYGNDFVYNKFVSY